jgi:hypothetical protein
MSELLEGDGCERRVKLLGADRDVHATGLPKSAEQLYAKAARAAMRR